jgi:hypothetical protein
MIYSQTAIYKIASEDERAKLLRKLVQQREY